MPKNHINQLDPEDFYALDTKEEIEEFIESYTLGGFDNYNEDRYSDFDMDNYGYDEYSY
jgi:hypothetical protein